MVLDSEKLTVQRESTQVNIRTHRQEVLQYELGKDAPSTCMHISLAFPPLLRKPSFGVLHVSQLKINSVRILPGEVRDPNRLTC